MKCKFNVKGMWNSFKLTAKDWSPEAYILLGIAGGVYAAVKACQASRKLDDVLEEHKDDVTEVREAYSDCPEEEKKELAKVYLATGGKLAKLYGPSVAIGAMSVTGILAGNRILRKRNVSLAAAYAAVDSGFKAYRGQVIEKLGEEVDQAFRFGSEKTAVTETVTDENGNQTTVTQEAEVIPEGKCPGYSRVFAYGDSPYAEPNYDYNRMFLESQQNVLNHKLRKDGFLLLNDVYAAIGCQPSKDGMTVGWVYDKHREDHGDNYIDLRIREVYRKTDTPNGVFHEKVLLIDPNVDGTIFNHANKLGLISD